MRRFFNYVVQDDQLDPSKGEFDDLLYFPDDDTLPFSTNERVPSSTSQSHHNNEIFLDNKTGIKQTVNHEHNQEQHHSNSKTNISNSPSSNLNPTDTQEEKDNNQSSDNEVRSSIKHETLKQDENITLDHEITDKIVRHVAKTLHEYNHEDNLNNGVSPEDVCDTLKNLAEALVWADENDSSDSHVWDSFLEVRIMPLLVGCLKKSDSHLYHKPDTMGDSSGSEVEVNINSTPGDGNSKQENDPDIENSTNEHDRLSEQKDEQETERHTTSSKGDTDPVMQGTHNTKQSNHLSNSNTDLMERSDTKSTIIHSRILQTLSILVQSVTQRNSLLNLFSANHMNDILSFNFDFQNEELVGYFISLVKSIALKLDNSLVQLFFDPTKGSFPLFSSITRFFDNPESMVRIAVRNISLTLLSLEDEELLKYIGRDDDKFFQNNVDLLTRLCGSVARAFELIIDDGREIRRTRSRTGFFHRRVKTSDVTAKLIEIENIFTYLGEVVNVSNLHIRPVVLKIMASKLFAPFFRPIASRASPKALQQYRRSWRLSRRTTAETTFAIPLFDAAARTILLSCFLKWSNSPFLVAALLWDLTHRSEEFQYRHVLHGLKAMATEVAGTERVTFISLCAIEAFVNCEYVTKEAFEIFRYNFETTEFSKPNDHLIEQARRALMHIQSWQTYEESHSERGPMMMSLHNFDSLLTASTSAPPISPALSMASYDSMTSPIGLARATSTPITDPLALNPPSDYGSGVSSDINDDTNGTSSFQIGEISLQETLLSIVLVIRRKEVRTMRVIHSIYRTITAVGKRCDQKLSAAIVAKNIVDELAVSIHTFLATKSTTIVAIECMFDNLRTLAESQTETTEKVSDLDSILSSDRVVTHASEFPASAGKRRLRTSEDNTPPTEIEDAQIFFTSLRLYEETLRESGQGNSVASLMSECIDILTQCGKEETYLEKKFALQDLGAAVIAHGQEI